MKTSFGKLLHKFMRCYLPDDRGSSPRTISSYRYAFIQFIECMESKGTPIDKISMDHFTNKNVREFLRWLEDTKGLSVASVNQRLAALKSFASFSKYEYPEYMVECEHIAKIKPKRKEHKTVPFLSTEGMGVLLGSIDKSTKSGLRDYTMILMLFLTGIRVSELVGIKCRDVIFSSSPRYIVIHGKGNKTRHIPIAKELKDQLVRYQSVMDFTSTNNYDRPLFTNHSKDGFTRQGINYTLSKYAKIAREKYPALIPVNISPHKIRHSTAMSLVEEGTELIVIRDLLGHSSVQTTEIYAKLSSKRKREAIEEASAKIVPTETAQWEESTSLKDWLKSFK